MTPEERRQAVEALEVLRPLGVSLVESARETAARRERVQRTTGALEKSCAKHKSIPEDNGMMMISLKSKKLLMKFFARKAGYDYDPGGIRRLD